MSIKTLRKRIALVAVSALGVGVLSVTPAFAVAIVANDVDIVSTAKTAICTVDSDKEVAYVPLNSAGVVISPANAADAETGFMTISGPGVWYAESDGTAGAITINSQKEAEITDVGTTAVSATLLPTGVGTITVTISETSGGVAIDTLTIYVQAACTNATWSSTYSLVQMSTTAAGNASSNVDANTSTTAGTPMYIKLQPKDGYNTAITTGTLFASATNGATVSWGAAAAGFPAGSGSVATATPTANHQLRVDPASSATTSTTTVSITLNGTAVATKTITFHGEQASIAIVKVASGRTSTANTGYVFYQYKDSAGNVVPGSAASFVAASAGTRITTGTSIKAPGTSAASILADANIADNVEYAAGQATANGMMMYTCGSSSGEAKFTIAATSTVNSNTLTQEVTGKCNGGIASYTVSTDKATYKVGEIATITVEAKDSSGNPVSDNTQLSASSFSIGGGTATYTILGTDAAAGSEVFSGGKVSLKAQMTTAGSFNTVVQLAGLSSTAAYTITDGAVSNAEVLAAIVKLIASINKQIAALQKSLKR